MELLLEPAQITALVKVIQEAALLTILVRTGNANYPGKRASADEDIDGLSGEEINRLVWVGSNNYK